MEILFRLVVEGDDAKEQAQDFQTRFQLAVEQFQNAITVETRHVVLSEADERLMAVIKDWLTPLDFVKQFEDYYKRLTPETGGEFLENETIKSWMDGNSSTRHVFCEGPRKSYRL